MSLVLLHALCTARLQLGQYMKWGACGCVSEETVEQGIPVYRFILPLDTFNRPKDGSPDCYSLPGSKPLPDGLSEISQCFYGKLCWLQGASIPLPICQETDYYYYVFTLTVIILLMVLYKEFITVFSWCFSLLFVACVFLFFPSSLCNSLYVCFTSTYR